MRPIDADAIFPWYVEAFKGEIEPHDVRFSMHDIEMNLSNIPTIDAVPVIRCKDCKYYEEQDETIGTCLLTVSRAHINGYCAWAERKDNGNR